MEIREPGPDDAARMKAIGIATVGVMGSSRDAHEDLAGPLGALLARLELNLLTGAGRGVMTSVCRAFAEARRGRGISIGIVPCESLEVRNVPRSGSPNAWVDLPIYTHLPSSGIEGTDDLSRNHINVLSSDVVIALPGSEGTASEIELALRYRKPVAVFAPSAVEVQHFNPAVARYADIAAIETFLNDHLSGRRAKNI
jgi:uncharacterized protein (TIGR00725 family)